jgi:hypothetical protein
MQEAVVMTVPAKLVTDTEAIALYVADGNPREDWAALDDRDRWPWRKMALERESDWDRFESDNARWAASFLNR